MKPLHARWLIKLYNMMTTGEGKQVIKSGWEAAGITEAIEIGSKNLPSLDPSRDISPINDEVHFAIVIPFQDQETDSSISGMRRMKILLIGMMAMPLIYLIKHYT